MFFLKIFSTILVSAIAIAKDLWSDKLKKNKQVKNGLLFLMILAGIVSVTTTWLDEIRSDELSIKQEARSSALTKQNDSLRFKIDSLIVFSRKGSQETRVQNLALQEKVSELGSKLEPFRSNSISFRTKEVKKIEAGYSLVVQFQPSKNVPLGELQFSVKVVQPSEARILDIWPDLRGGGFFHGNDSKNISSDGKSAKLQYSLMTAGHPTIEVKVTRRCTLEIEGNNGLSPTIVQVE